jgi:hypothetical protein
MAAGSTHGGAEGNGAEIRRNGEIKMPAKAMAVSRDAAARHSSRPGSDPAGDRFRYLLNRLSWSSDFQEAGSTPATSLTDAQHRIEREARPPMRCAGRRGRPPQLLGKWPLADCAALRASRFPAWQRRVAAMPHSERCCGIPAKRARTSVSRYRR